MLGVISQSNYTCIVGQQQVGEFLTHTGCAEQLHSHDTRVLKVMPAPYTQHTHGKEYRTRRAKALLMRALSPMSLATAGGGVLKRRKDT